MPTPMWEPASNAIQAAQISTFIERAKRKYGLPLEGYKGLHQWSVDAPADFWSEVWQFTQVIASSQSEHTLLDEDKFPGARWFPTARLNFAENLLRWQDDRVALVTLLENGSRQELTYAELYSKVAQLASALRADGVVAGDRVAAIMPNIAETSIAMLATTSIGAVWSSCSPDFGISGLMDRIGQIKPKVLLCADGYFYAGKTCESLDRAGAIADQVESIERVVVVPVVNSLATLGSISNARLFADYLDTQAAEVKFEQLPFDHPLYIMYSSGTTGMPKCIVHGAGGTLLQHLKEHQLLVDLRRDDVFFYFSTCGWMMWNWLVSGLATGATLILYDGSPFAKHGNVLLDAIDSENISVFGVGAKYIASLEKAGKRPAQTHQLKNLRAILSTGSPLSPESFDYIYRDFKSDICLSSISGGTDILSCFVGACTILPVYRGEIQAKGLGMAVEIWDDIGQSVVGKKGELVCTKPFPCAPIGFWNDEGGTKYREAYFSRWPNIWSQGDYGEITANGGIVIHGRSDAVLNPGGVRIGTAEIYRQVEKLEEVEESIVIGQDWGDDVRVVLFVVCANESALNDELRARIKTVIRTNTTPRHVPAKIIQVKAIPRTISGKIVELAVREVVHGRPVKNVDALANPEALEHFRGLDELLT